MPRSSRTSSLRCHHGAGDIHRGNLGESDAGDWRGPNLLHVKNVHRDGGQSAVAAVAYCAGEICPKGGPDVMLDPKGQMVTSSAGRRRLWEEREREGPLDDKNLKASTD